MLVQKKPVLPFLVFFWKTARKTTKKQGFSIPTEPLKSLEKKGKTLRKTQRIPKKQGKEGQGRPQLGPRNLSENPLTLRIFSGYSYPLGSFPFCKVIFGDPPKLSGIVSCDSAAMRIRIRIVRCQQPAKRQKHKPCETQGLFFSRRSLCWQSGIGLESA